MNARHAWRLLRTPGFVRSQAQDLWISARSVLASDAFARVYRTVRPYTMSGGARLRGLYDAVRNVDAHAVAGDIVECGTARGGSAALLGLAMRQSTRVRTLWLFDTFEGMPPPTSADPDYDIAATYTGRCRGDVDEVRALFDRLGILANSRFVKGRFEETVPRAEVRAIAVLHVDGDWYESVKVCLDHLYDRVTPGGIIQIDDYGHWEGARKAVDEFMAGRRIAEPLRYVDYTARQLVRT
jgi:hypothetical protein